MADPPPDGKNIPPSRVTISAFSDCTGLGKCLNHPGKMITQRISTAIVMIVFIASSVIWIYGRYQQRPVTIPTREAPNPPMIRPRAPGNYIKVLSLDGYGIRMLPALHCLADLEERAGKPVSQMFDVIVGTSSGGLIAAALTTPAKDGTPLFSAKQLLEAYPKVMQRMYAAPLIHPLLSLEGRSAPRYLTRERHRVLLELFGKTSQVGDALTTIILPAYAVDQHTPFFFASDMGKSTVPGDGPGRSATEAGDYFLADALTATTGDPSLFAPSRITNIGREQSFTFISAQAYAANPTLIAVGEALLRFPGRQCVVISLGAGVPQEDASSPHNAWTLTAAEHLIDAAATGNAVTTSQITSLLHRFGSGPVAAYIRLDPVIPVTSSQPDDFSKTNIDELNKAGEKLTAEKAATLERTAAFLATQ